MGQHDKKSIVNENYARLKADFQPDHGRFCKFFYLWGGGAAASVAPPPATYAYESNDL